MDIIYLLTFIFIVGLFFTIVLAFLYLRKEKMYGLSSGLALQLFLISIPETSIKQGENFGEALKNFIMEMEKFLMGISSIKSGFKKSFFGKPSFALEIASHNMGSEIFFYVAFPRKYAQLLSSQLHGSFPDAKIEPVKDYNIFHPEGSYAGAALTLAESTVFPIKTYLKTTGDPLEITTSIFSKLKEYGEGAVLQIILRPSSGSTNKWARSVAYEFKKGKTKKEIFTGKGWSETFFKVFSDFFSKSQPNQEQEKKPIIADENLVKLLEEKSGKIIFDCNIRILSSAKTVDETNRLIKELGAGFNQFESADGNKFKINELSGKELRKMIENFSFRVFDEKFSIPLNVEEISSVYHFPVSKKSAPGVRTLKAKEATPPINLPKEGVLLGQSHFRGESLNVFIKKEDRRRHFYIIGQTGTGKSVLMQNMVSQDIKNGEGVCIIDPHGETIEKILPLIPKERTEDIIYFDPGDVSRPLGLNMLEYDTRYPEQKSLIVNELFEIFNKLFNMSVAGGPMFEQYFRNATMLVMEDPSSGNTLLEVERVLVDKDFRELKLSRNKNIVVETFWRQVAEKAQGEQSLANMVPYIVSKFDTFLSNDIMRPIIMQEHSSFNVRDVMDQKKILLLNLSKGKLGELNSNLLGLIMVGKILMASLSRVEIPEAERKDFYLYIDEFQNVTTKSIATILSEARKYRLDLIVTHQFIGQLEEEIKKSIFGNVGSMCSFRIGADDAEYLEKQFSPVFSSSDLLNIDNYNAYLKLLIDGQTSKAFNIKTILPETGNPELAKEIKNLSKLKYGRPKEEVEAEIVNKHKKL